MLFSPSYKNRLIVSVMSTIPLPLSPHALAWGHLLPLAQAVATGSIDGFYSRSISLGPAPSAFDEQKTLPVTLINGPDGALYASQRLIDRLSQLGLSGIPAIQASLMARTFPVTVPKDCFAAGPHSTLNPPGSTYSWVAVHLPAETLVFSGALPLRPDLESLCRTIFPAAHVQNGVGTPPPPRNLFSASSTAALALTKISPARRFGLSSLALLFVFLIAQVALFLFSAPILMQLFVFFLFLIALGFLAHLGRQAFQSTSTSL